MSRFWRGLSFTKVWAKTPLEGLNQTQAYIAAEYRARGHAAETNAERLLRNAEVSTRAHPGENAQFCSGSR
jgi:hypothetical protein